MSSGAQVPLNGRKSANYGDVQHLGTAGSPVWLTVGDVCTELQIARSTWEKWRQKGVAPKAVRLPNGQLRVRCEWLDAWLADRLQAQPARRLQGVEAARRRIDLPRGEELVHVACRVAGNREQRCRCPAGGSTVHAHPVEAAEAIQ